MHDLYHNDHHDHGLAHDLVALRRLSDRRRALRWLGGAGTVALVAACDGSSADAGTDTSASVTSPTPTPTPTAIAVATPTPTATATTGTCVADPTETNGPYPADGTNSASGATSNVLTVASAVRSDIRASFVGSSTAVAAGVPITLTLTVVNVNSACAPLAGYAVYLWHCDREGRYSLYDLPAESYLRGIGVTDANGQVTFTSIFPGCYAGRYPHIHFEVFSSLATATSGRYATLVGQLALPAAACSAVYASAGYASSLANFAAVSIARDNVFGDNTAAQVAQQTPAFTGSVADGYVLRGTVGLAR